MHINFIEFSKFSFVRMTDREPCLTQDEKNEKRTWPDCEWN